ncbi:MAG: class I SAM-dependent methyltransferase [Hymenobacter sp.]
MHYDPIKRSLGNVFNRSPWLRRCSTTCSIYCCCAPGTCTANCANGRMAAPAEPLDILDAGAGYGQYSYWLSGLSSLWRILAVDVKGGAGSRFQPVFPQSSAGRKCSSRCRTWCCTKSPTRSTWPSSVDVMEHILEDVEVFRNVHASLKDGGMLLISTPSDQGGSDVHGDSEIELHRGARARWLQYPRDSAEAAHRRLRAHRGPLQLRRAGPDFVAARA